jgi:putative membrane protein
MDQSSTTLKSTNILITVVSVAIPLVVAILLYAPFTVDLGSEFVYFLPHLNAVINSSTSVLLIAALLFIKAKNISLHKASMNSAFVLGAIFLVSYVLYHASTESTSFGGEGWIRPVYYALLISHILLAAVVVPFVLFAITYAWQGKFDKHKKVVKWAYPIWLYVSVTGVIVYFMIRPYYQF